MQKSLLILNIFLILYNCNGLEYVYGQQKNESLIKNSTIINVEGDDSGQFHRYLIDFIGSAKDDAPKYKILVNSLKTETAEVINKDGTASRFKIQYSIKYQLFIISKNCEIVNMDIITTNTYNSKSAGYSFGTDLSKKETGNQNINKNIKKFLSSLNNLSDINICRE